MAGKSVTNGNWSRIGDNNLGLGLHRYVSGSGASEKVLWRLEVTGNSNRKLVEIDAATSDLRQIMSWCEKSIETLQTDGGRNVDDEPVVVAADAA